MACYKIHGLTIFSALKFPELEVKKTGDTDVNIQMGTVESISHENQITINLSKFVKLKISPNLIQFSWNNNIICNMDNHNKITVNMKSRLDESFLRYFIFGNVFPIVLHRKGRLVLHGNAVNINNNTTAFLGVSGQGKSTISLALYKRGYPILADDILSFKMNSTKKPTIYPSFPRMKLWPNVIENINENPEIIPKVHEYTSKRFYDTSNDFSYDIKDLDNIYVICKGSENSIKDINPSKAVLELIKSSYCFKLFNKTELCENFDQCTEIVNDIPVKKLEIKHSFEDMDKLVKLIENDIFTLFC